MIYRSPKRSLVVLALILASISCATAPGADPIVVRGEQTWRIGFDVVDAFVILERGGTVPILKSPAVHAFAEKLRTPNPEGVLFPTGAVKPYGVWIFDKLDQAIQDYKATRTPAGQAKLQSYLSLVEELIATASKAMKAGL